MMPEHRPTMPRPSMPARVQTPVYCVAQDHAGQFRGWLVRCRTESELWRLPVVRLPSSVFCHQFSEASLLWLQLSLLLSVARDRQEASLADIQHRQVESNRFVPAVRRAVRMNRRRQQAVAALQPEFAIAKREKLPLLNLGIAVDDIEVTSAIDVPPFRGRHRRQNVGKFAMLGRPA